MSLSPGITGQSALNALLRCPLALSVAGTRPVPSVAVPPRFDMRPGQLCVRCHVGRQAAEVARWWSFHEDLHATTQVLGELAWKPHVATQVPVQLVGLAAACERWRSFGQHGPGCGPADVLGKGLAGGPARVLPWHCSRPRQGACRGSCGFPRLGSRRGSPSSGPYLISHVYDLDKDLHATTEAPPKPWFQCSWLAGVGTHGLKGGLLCWHRASCPGKALARAAEAAPARYCRGSPPRPFALLCFWSWRGLGCLALRLLSGFPLLPC